MQDIINPTEINVNETNQFKIELKLTKKKLHVKLNKTDWLMDEEWNPLSFNDNFFFSTYGRTFSQKANKLLSLKPKRNGYISYNLNIKGEKKRKSYYAHNLMMSENVGPRPKGSLIDHIDRNRINNKLSNLRYVTVSESNKNRSQLKNKNGTYSKKVHQLDLNGNIIKIWGSTAEAARALSLDSRRISDNACGRRGKIYGGYIWKYISDVIENEIWKNINVVKGKLSISNMGRGKTGELLETYGSENDDGYMRISVGGVQFMMHRLICEAFNGPPPNNDYNYQVNHKDKNRKNNKSDNLEWVTSQENTEHGIGKSITQYTSKGKIIAKYNSITKAASATGICAEIIGNICKKKCYKSKKTSDVFRYSDDTFETIKIMKSQIGSGKKIIQISLDGEEIEQYNSIDEASRILKVSNSCIRKHLKNNTIHKGYKWKLA